MKAVIYTLWVWCILCTPATAATPIIDTVLAGEEAIYSVENTVNYYEWTIEGGEIVEGSGTNQIRVIWTGKEGFHQLSVQALNSTGCPGDPKIGLILLKRNPARAYVYTPTAFSPNGDGTNDEFSPIITSNYSDFRMMIFSRWGSIVFESTNPDIKWDGTCQGVAVQDGNYIVRILLITAEYKRIEEVSTVIVVR